ncbi:MAG: response regulator [candidate division Zixibacteria bacterium]|nr:response regulator [candidate division Zixibacteria bacterium]
MSSYGFDRINKLAQQRGEPYKVLIVDDEKWIRDVFADFCKLTDAFKVDLVQSGREAIEKAQVTSYDLITVDLIMPEISGLEVLTEIKRISPQVPVMIVTGNATDRLVREAGVMGACRVLYKPVTLDDFVENMISTLDR